VAVAAFPFFSSFAPAKALVAGGGLAGALVWRKRRGPTAFARSFGPTFSTLVLALLYLVVSLPSLLFPHARGAALHAAHLDLVGVAVFLVARGAALQERFVERLAGWGSIAILLVAVPAAIELILGRPVLGYSLLPGGTTLGNPDFAAELVAVLLPAAALGLADFRRSGPDRPPPSSPRWTAWMSLAAVAAALLLLALIPSVTARLAVGATLLLALLWLAKPLVGGCSATDPTPDRPRKSRVGGCSATDPTPDRPRKSRVGGGAAPAPLVFAILLAAVAAAVVLLWGEGRLHLYRTALDCALEHPWTGHGAGGFSGCFLEQQAERVAADPALLPFWTNARHAHDEWLQLWVERGILPPLVLVLLFGVAFLRSLLGRGRQLWVAAGILAAGLCASGSVTLAHYPGRIVTFLWLGLACAPILQRKEGSDERPDMPDPSTSLLSKGPVLDSEGRTPQARTRREQPFSGPVKGGEGVADMSLAAWPVAFFLVLAPLWSAGIDALYVRGEYRLVLQLEGSHAGALLHQGQVLADSGNMEEGCGLVEQALEASPDIGTAVIAGVCRARNGELEEGVRHLETATRWHPRFGTAYANLAEVYRLAGRQEEAWRHITRALSLWPGRKDFQRIRKAVCRNNPFCLPAPPAPRYDSVRPTGSDRTNLPR